MTELRLAERDQADTAKKAPSDRTWLLAARGNLLTVVLFLAQALLRALEPAFSRSLLGAAVPTSRGLNSI